MLSFSKKSSHYSVLQKILISSLKVFSQGSLISWRKMIFQVTLKPTIDYKIMLKWRSTVYQKTILIRCQLIGVGNRLRRVQIQHWVERNFSNKETAGRVERSSWIKPYRIIYTGHKIALIRLHVIECEHCISYGFAISFWPLQDYPFRFTVGTFDFHYFEQNFTFYYFDY